MTRAVTLHARHRYHKAAWSETENRARFGWTSDAPGHGHLYRVEVTVDGPLDPETQMVIDLVRLDEILTETILTPLDGRHLNDAVPAFASGEQLPSCEAVAAWCFRQVADRLPSTVRLARVRVAEDDTLWADCTAPA